MHLLREYNKKYLRYADYDPTAASLGKSFYNDYLRLKTVGNDINYNNSTSNTLLCHPLPTHCFAAPSDAPAKTMFSTKKHALKPHTSWY